MSSANVTHHSRRALTHLAIGKAIGAAFGFAVMALIWRRVSPEGYGQYLTLLAVLELAYLLSGAGLSTVAQRHAPVWVMQRSAAAPAGRRLLALVGLRLLLRLGLPDLLPPEWLLLVLVTALFAWGFSVRRPVDVSP